MRETIYRSRSAANKLRAQVFLMYNKQLLNEVEHDIENYQGSRRLRWITQTEALTILGIMRKPNSLIVLLYIAVVLCIVIGQLQANKCGNHERVIILAFGWADNSYLDIDNSAYHKNLVQ